MRKGNKERGRSMFTNLGKHCATPWVQTATDIYFPFCLSSLSCLTSQVGCTRSSNTKQFGSQGIPQGLLRPNAFCFGLCQLMLRVLVRRNSRVCTRICRILPMRSGLQGLSSQGPRVDPPRARGKLADSDTIFDRTATSRKRVVLGRKSTS